MVRYERKKIMEEKKPLTKKEWEEIFAKILGYVAQVIVAVFLVMVVIYAIF